MKSSPVSAAEDQELRTSPVERKRKRSIHQPVPTVDQALNKQQTIQKLFSTSRKAAKGVTGPEYNLQGAKRVKPASADLESPLPPPPTGHSRDGMYTFTTKHASGDVVDLTKSPPRNGQPRRMSLVKPVRTSLNSHTGAKKLVVKNLRKEPLWDAEKYFEDVWEQLDHALVQIFKNSKATFSMEDLYRGVEYLCRQGKAAAINTKLNQKCFDHFEHDVVASLLAKRSFSDTELLRAVLTAWSSWNEQMILVQYIFYYMDRSYLLQSSKTTLHDVGVKLFRESVFNNPLLKPKIIEGACDLITADRSSEELDRSTLRQAIGMFHDLATYTSSFEPRILALSQTYVGEWAESKTSELGLSAYVRESAAFMAREVERCEVFGLDTTTRRDLLRLLEEHVVQQQVDYLTAPSDVATLLNDNSVNDLAELYNLLQRRRLGLHLKKAFSSWVDTTGTSIIFDDKAEDQMVVRLLSLKRRLDTIWRTSFQGNDDLGHGLRESFEMFINKTKKGVSTWGTDNSKPGEMIAKYVDLLLRGGAKAIPTQLTVASRDATGNDQEDPDEHLDEDMEVNSQLDQVLDLFRFVHGKAVFEAFYKKDLAKRLLMGRSASADAERSMLSRLKTECGAGFTQNLEQMFKDVELAREEMSSYKDRLEQREERPGNLDLSVNVLSAAAWPTYPDIPVIIPADVKVAIDGFETHYKSKHSGRKLSWKHALASCQLKARFPKGNKEFVVSSFQAIILLFFNGLGEGEHLTYEYIKTASGLSEVEVKRALQSLACAKLRPLTKRPLSKDINSEDTFTVNLAFSNPRARIRINQLQLKETKQENKETHERVAEDRNFECQAAVVRIMKSRKTVGHSELVAEVIKATRSRGVLAVPDIKRNIDRLIEKDYMEREDGNMYSYVA